MGVGDVQAPRTGGLVHLMCEAMGAAHGLCRRPANGMLCLGGSLVCPRLCGKVVMEYAGR
jgi:hypothetical protein